jgi:hypothetical protein
MAYVCLLYICWFFILHVSHKYQKLSKCQKKLWKNLKTKHGNQYDQDKRKRQTYNYIEFCTIWLIELHFQFCLISNFHFYEFSIVQFCQMQRTCEVYLRYVCNIHNTKSGTSLHTGWPGEFVQNSPRREQSPKRRRFAQTGPSAHSTTF